VGGGSGSAQLIVRKLSALAIAQVVVPATPRTTATATSTASTPRAKSDTASLSTSLSTSLSFEGQESGAGSPLSTPTTSSASTPTSSRLPPAAASLSGLLLRVPRKVTELVAQDEADDAWSLDGRSSGGSCGSSLGFKSISDVDQHVDTIQEEEEEHQDNHQESVAWQQTKGGFPGDDDDDDDHGGDGDGDDGSVEEEVEAELSSDEGGTDDDDDDDQNGGDDDEVGEEKGIEYLLKKYFPESLAAIEQEAPPEPNPEKEEKKKQKKQKKKRSHKKKEKKTKKKTAKPELTLADGRDEAQIKRNKEDDATQPSAASRLAFSVDGVALERRDKAREKYQSLYIPSLNLRSSADADADADDSDADAEADERKPSSTGEGKRKVRHRSDRERRMPQSAREGFGRKSARELGMIFRCRSREDVTDDERNAADADPAVASPRGARRPRSRTLEPVPRPIEAQPSPRAKTKHSWIIRREDHQRPPAPNNANIERERVGQVYGRLSVSTSSFTLTADSSSSPASSVFSASGVLSPRKKTGSFRSLLSGRRATGSPTAEAQQQQLRRDVILAEPPTLASSSSSSSSSSWSSKSAPPFTSISSSASSSSPSTTTSSPSPSPSSSSTTSAPSSMRRGRSSSLNKAAGLFKRSGSLRKTRADNDNVGGCALASGDSRSGPAVGDQQKMEKKEKTVGGIKKSWREVKSYFASDREVKTYFNGSASLGPQPWSPNVTHTCQNL
jgi:hypothetical protein